MKKRSKILACIASALVLATTLSTTAFAAVPEDAVDSTIETRNSTFPSYTMKTSTGIDGAKKWFDCDPSKRIEYTNVTVSCALTTAKGRVGLWKKPGIGGVNMPLNQIFNRSEGKYNHRAYWNTDITASYYLLHLEAVNNELDNGTLTPFKTEGTFQNY